MDTLFRLYRDHVDHLCRSYATLLAQHGLDAVVLHAGTALRKSTADDQYWPLRLAPVFGHWLPLQAAGSLLVVRADGRRPLLLWLHDAGFWEQPPAPEHRLFEQVMEVVVVRDAAQLGAHLPHGRVAWVGDLRDQRHDGTALQPPAALVDDLDELRVTKTPYEIACIAEANLRAAAGHDALREAFAVGGHSELALHLRYLAATRQDDPETPYKNIVAMGEHAAVLHHVSYGRQPSERAAETLLVDAGATCMGYHADITRTWLRGQGATADVFAQLLAGVERLQLHLCDGAQIGRPYEDLHDEAHLLIGQLLRDTGLVRASPEAAVAKDITFAFFPHGLGHALGLQTHDVGCARIRPRSDNPFLRNTRRIEAGQVFTIEPGLYFIDALLRPLRAGSHAHLVDWPLVEALQPLGGIRIEDDLLVTADGHGHRNFTREVLPWGGGRV